MFVWVDESGCQKKDGIRKFGYALRGLTPVREWILVRGEHISTIAAMDVNGIVALELALGAVNADNFFDFARGTLLPNLLPFDGCNPRSVVIMDNCSIHHVHLIRELFRDAGVLLLHLPPYSPDLNPLEEAFSKVKYYLNEHDTIMQCIPSPIPLIQAAFDSITESDCKGWVSHSGYGF